MTIAEAIEIINQWLPVNRWPPNPNLKTAMELGIEALKRIGVGRRTGRFSWEDLLPGETED